MGSIWLNGQTPGYPSLLDVCAGAGLHVRTYSGWEHRSRSSGGIDVLQAVIVHHTASSASFDNDWNYCVNASDGPVANMLLGRDGTVGIHAGGASNHAGKGGPWTSAYGTASKGTIPADSCNSRSIGIEAQNAGTGEVWASVMIDAYERLCAALCSAYGLQAGDVIAHYEWGGPNVPQAGRKIDPWGPAEGVSYGGSRPWVMRGGAGFCDAVARRMAGGPAPAPDDDLTEPHLATWAHH